MCTKQSLKSVLLTTAGYGSVLIVVGGLGGCSTPVKVQRIEYQEPEKVASIDTELPFELMVARLKSDTDSPAQPTPLSTIKLAKEALEAIYDVDAKLVASTLQKDPNRIHALETVAQLDREHAQTLMTIIERFGWPSREMVGLKAVQGAYIAVQHAGHDPDFQSSCLLLIQQQVDQGDLPGAFLALMTDRIAVSRGDSQIYGTQMTMESDGYGVMRAVPAASIWLESELDQRRQILGMPNHQRFIEAIELAYFNSISQSDAQVTSVPTE